jgi:hypothetical protein
MAYFALGRVMILSTAVQGTPMMSEWFDRRACAESWRLAEVYESVLVARENAVQKLSVGSISVLSEP